MFFVTPRPWNCFTKANAGPSDRKPGGGPDYRRWRENVGPTSSVAETGVLRASGAH